VADHWLSKLDKKLLDDATLIGEEAAKFGCRSYLVGGIVRDLILGRPNADLDVVVEGNAIQLGRRLAGIMKMQIITYAEFRTAKLFDSKGRHIDLASARREFYPKPAALPVVDEGNLQADLFRRDFTINAIALSLSPGSFGQLADMYAGQDDLAAGIIRVFHDNSFEDDPTRIFRAIRFEQRFDFRMEERTAELFNKAIKSKVYKKLSDPRFFAELKKILREDEPLKPLGRLKALGLLSLAGEALTWDARAMLHCHKGVEKFTRKADAEDVRGRWIYYFIELLKGRSAPTIRKICQHVQLSRELENAVVQSMDAYKVLKKLKSRDLSKSDIFFLMRAYDKRAIRYFRMACTQEKMARLVDEYLDKWQGISLHVNGEDIKKLGVAAGKRIGEVLEALLKRKIDRGLKTKAQEIKAAKEILAVK
jgi:tRNA nucleotidyltransferase (CCA-adding enzyme)